MENNKLSFKEWCINHNKEYLMEGWSDENDITLDKVPHDSKIHYKWICEKGHIREQSVLSRKRNGCKYCSNKAILKGYNDLETVYPDIAKQWNYKRNVDLKPDMVTYGSGKRVWWECNKGHEWKAMIGDRTRNKYGCPKCARSQTSFPEQALSYYLSKYLKIESRQKVLGKELDILISGYKIGIEYDGMAWHNDDTSINRERAKNECVTKFGFTLFRIKESDKNLTIGNTIYYSFKRDNYTEFESAIKKLLKKISCLTNTDFDYDINIKRDETEILQAISNYKNKNSIVVTHPNIAAQWNYKKNIDLIPENFSKGSHYKAWWVCPINHEYQMSIKHRTISKADCPYCSGNKLLKGFNDLESWCIKNEKQDILKAWSKNNERKIDEVHYYTKTKVYWVCKKGHEFYASIDSYVHQNRRCPYCSGNKILVGFNDLKTWCIENNKQHIIEEWDYDKNDINILDVSKGSNKKVNWICKHGHTWTAIINDRANKDSGCPICYKLDRSGKVDL